ncbi:hypothetical protein BLNAU_20432 [Blattamonas nauphoetae]|uniref:GPS domain-containing protein n=1 Tax=Blattamonas nauphoetae TaxID=2049346 RepID=A0ABQ9WYN5_9EUKA|nr:hypothetical protein BLNAU_20432 [Blattamonas nauphoetae]
MPDLPLLHVLSMSFETYLSSTTLLNATSSTVQNAFSQSAQSPLSQRLVSSQISHSTNHLSGTAITDLNKCTNMLSSNTSFQHCTSSNTNIYHRTQYTIPQGSDCSFTLCTFKKCSATSYGGAIHSNTNNLSLSVDKCAFDTCTASSSGGAIFFGLPSGSVNTVQILSSTFASCSSDAGYSGSLRFGLSAAVSLIISSCVIIDSSASSYAGGLYVATWNQASSGGGISNCLFQNCAQTDAEGYFGGGGIAFWTCTSVMLDSVQFRACTSALTKGHDVYFSGGSATASSSTFVNCDSNSTDSGNRVEPIASSSLLPNPTLTTTITSIKATISGSSATIEVRLTSAVSGTLLVVLSNMGATRTPTVQEAPLIKRVISFPSLASNVGSCTVSIGANGLLQTPLTEYVVDTASLAKTTVSFTSSLPLDIVTTSMTLGTISYSEKDKKMNVKLNGVGLEGTYTLVLSKNGTNSNNQSVSVVFSSNTASFDAVLYTSSGTGNMTYNTTYAVIAYSKGVEQFAAPGVSFTTKVEPSRLVTFILKANDSQVKTVFFSMSGRALDTNSKYKVGLSISGALKHTIEMGMNSSSGLWEGSAILYPSSSAQLEYGKTYEVSSFKKGVDSTELFFETNTINITPEPARLVKVESHDALGLNSTTVTLFTLALTNGAECNLQLTGTPLDSSLNSAHIVPLSFRATSQTTYTFVLSLYPTDEAELKYGHTYSMNWINADATPVLFELAACSFSTPTEPERLVKLSCDGTFSDAKKKTITVTFESRCLKSSTEYSIVLKSTATAEVLSHTKTIKLKTDANGLLPPHTAVLFPTKTIAAERDGQLEFGLTYTVDGFKRGVDPLIYDTEYITLTTPTEPTRLTEIKCTGWADKGLKATFSSSGRKMSVGETYTLKLKKSGAATTKKVDMTFTTAESGTGVASLTFQSSTDIELEYDTTYEVTEVTNSALASMLCEDGLTFTIATQPPCLIWFYPLHYDALMKKLNLEMTGRSLDTTSTYRVGLSIAGTLKHTVEMKYNATLAGWRGSALLYPSDSAELEYGKTYAVSSFRKGGDTTELFFEVITIIIASEPARLVKVESSDAVGLNSSTLTISTLALTNGAKYTLELQGTPLDSSSNSIHIVPLSFTATSQPKHSITLSLYPTEDADLKYGHKYLADWMETGTQPVLIETDACSFSTPIEPARLVSKSDAGLNGAKSKITIVFEARALTDTVGPVWVSSGNNYWRHDSSIRVLSQTRCEADFLVAAVQDTTHLEFEMEYTVCIKPGETSTLLVDSGIKVRVPSPPIVNSASVQLNVVNTAMNLVLSGYDLQLDADYKVTLTSGRSIVILFTEETKARSPLLLLGRVNGLAYGTTYAIQSITRVGDSQDIILLRGTVSFKTPNKPDPLTLNVNTDNSETNPDCGDYAQPCSSIDVAWWIVEDIAPNGIVFQIIESVMLSSPITISTQTLMVITNADNLIGTLRIPSSALQAGSPLIVVSSSTMLQIDSTNVVIESTDSSFVFIFAEESTVSLISGSIVGSGQVTEQEELCDWSSGMIRIDQSNLTIQSMKLTDLQQGAIRMSGGNVTITDTSFQRNSPNVAAFPSLSHNIHCSGQGNIDVNSLSGGDGSPASPSAWISLNDCALSSSVVNPSSPFFVPTLSTSSKSTLNKKTEEIALSIVGTTLIPCGLLLEIYEITPEGEGSFIQISPSSVAPSTWTETEISLTLPVSSLASIQFDLELRAHLVFGAGERSTGWFLVKKKGTFQGEIIVDRTGTADPSECGGWDEPCSTLNLGWIVGLTEKEGDEEIVLMVVGEGLLVDKIWVNEDSLKISAEPDTRSVVKVSLESSVWGEEGWEDGKGIVNVDGGRVAIDSVMIVMPSLSNLKSTPPVAIIWGWGTVTISSVHLSQESSAKVGLGLVDQTRGGLTMSDVAIESVVLGTNVTLVKGESRSKELLMSLFGWTVKNTRSRDSPLIVFNSSSPSSHFELSDSSFSRTVVGEEGVTLHERKLVSVSSAQKAFLLYGCSFAECAVLGTGRRNSVLSVVVACTSSPQVTLSNSQFTRSTNTSSSSSLHIVAVSALTRVKLNNCRFIVGRRSGSTAALSSRGGVLVEYSAILPIVVRQKVEFGGCSLEVRRPVQSASTPLHCDPLPSLEPTLSEIEEVIRGYCSSLRNYCEKETLPILSEIRTFLESDLEELPNRCAIAESCGLVSILSDIVSSHSSVGLRSIASSLLALIQNALGSRDIQATVNTINEQLVELRTTVCNLTTQMAEHLDRINSRLMKFDSRLSCLEEKRRSDLLRESRFQRWSKKGADAIEIFDEDFFIKTGNTFTLRQRPENEKTNFIPKTLFSPLISSDVAQLSLTFTHSSGGYRYGAISPHLVDTGTHEDLFRETRGRATWGFRYTPPAPAHGNGAPAQQQTEQIELEADCHVGRRTLRLLEDGDVHSDLFTNLPLPFRFAITLHHSSVSVTINSLTFTAKPKLKGGTNKSKFPS